jgi:hypothetical protein
MRLEENYIRRYTISTSHHVLLRQSNHGNERSLWHDESEQKCTPGFGEKTIRSNPEDLDMS